VKERVDILLVKNGLCQSRTEAQRLVMAGQVRIGTDHVIRKPSETVPEDTVLEVTEPFPYVSRGAEKLRAALVESKPDLLNAVALDVGASTGGFTDLLLQSGAARVYAVDVGYGQLHQKLRDDPRVICLEKVNARHLTAAEVPELVDILTADVSFISLTKILPACSRLVRPGGWAFLLVKPQFEAERAEVGKGGVVRDPDVQQRCVNKICEFCTQHLGWRRMQVVPSPIQGPKGNQEFIAVLRTGEKQPPSAES
jgi:23S rRNA (cytidine1920-2'-O)/16S rRNA (cytidine1409-2'-O)-methyltransferase